jgi:Uma2 family endonuclease
MRRSAAASERPRLLSIEEWADLDDEIEGELVDGVLEDEEMANVLHEAIVVWLSAILNAWARRRRGLTTGSETKLAVGPRRGRKPDLSVFLPPSLPSPSDTLVRVPAHLVIEVVSPRPRDARRDRIEKLGDYARAGVRHYGILDPQLRSIEIYELGRDRRYTVALTATRGRVRVPGCPGLTLDLESLWKEVDEIDRRSVAAVRRR